MEAPRTTSSADLWSRLARLDKTCEIRVTKVQQPAGWQVLVTKRVDAPGPPIRILGPTMGEALTAAVNQAEASNWQVAG